MKKLDSFGQLNGHLNHIIRNHISVSGADLIKENVLSVW